MFPVLDPKIFAMKPWALHGPARAPGAGALLAGKGGPCIAKSGMFSRGFSGFGSLVRLVGHARAGGRLCAACYKEALPRPPARRAAGPLCLPEHRGRAA